MMSSKFGYRSGNKNHDWHQWSSLTTGWICWKSHDTEGPSDLSEGVYKHKVWSKKFYRETVFFPTVILSS